MSKDVSSAQSAMYSDAGALILHGTTQRWYPVRRTMLPEACAFLGYAPGAADFLDGGAIGPYRLCTYDPETGTIWSGGLRMDGLVTHWTPFLSPPKGAKIETVDALPRADAGAAMTLTKMEA